MKFKFIALSILYISMSISSAIGQDIINFEYQEIDITIFPKEPGVCPNGSADVTCLESFDSYIWEMVNPDPQFTTLYGQSQDLVFPGEYYLTVEKYIDGVLCSKQIVFEVHDLQNPEGIEKYLVKNGFYPIPIILEPTGLKNDLNSSSRSSCEFRNLKFKSEFQYIDLNLGQTLSDIVNNFKPFNNDDYDAIEVKSQNSCFCDVGINELEEEFYANPLSIWAHEFALSKDETEGKLYVKGLIPFEGDTPVSEDHISHLDEIYDLIITNEENNSDVQQATFEHLRIIISNVLMPHATGGYNLDTQCIISNEDVGDDYIFTPAGLAVHLPPEASNIVLENDVSSPFYGSVLRFDDINNYWQNYHRDEDIMVSNGFFNPINGTFFKEFSSLITDCTSCVIEITSISQSCDNFSCLLESNQYTTEYFDLEDTKDGGFNYEISSCNSLWSLWPISKRDSKQLVYDLLCAIKNGDPTFEFDAKFLDKVIFAKDIILADLSYDLVGVRMPKVGNSIVLLDTPVLNNNGTTFGFINSFEICTDSDVRLNFLKAELEDELESTEFNSSSCKKLINASYTIDKWNVKIGIINACLKYYNISDKYKLLQYLDPPDKKNLLIMVNGYRILGLSPGEKWYKGGVEYPTKSPHDAINTCFDNFEDGGYWGEAGASFADRINNNVIYVDGHHSIVTSNHLLMATDDLTATSFLNSLLSCLPLKYFCLDAICQLNTYPNGDGFFIRYLHGTSAGSNIWDKMVAGDIDVSLSDDKKQIIGKIDIVAHSMGYAYSKGMIDFLATKLAPDNNFGNFYIVAPENPRAYTDEEFDSYSPDTQNDVVVDLSLFESVFQYGSDFTTNGDKKCRQDGVAPQDRVRGLSEDNENNVFIPNSEEKNKNFVAAHVMKSYGWLFKIKKSEKGFIKPRI